MRRPAVRLPAPRLPRPSRRAVAGALLVVALLVPGWFWLRDSPLVRIDDVTVTGVSGPQAAAVRQALDRRGRADDHARTSTAGKLRDAVRPVPDRRRGRGPIPTRCTSSTSSSASGSPVGALANGDRRVAVAADGTLLEGTLTKGLPLVPVKLPPGGADGWPSPTRAGLVALLGAAPAALRATVSASASATTASAPSVSGGPELYFGAADRLAAKWAAAARVLADASSRGATYLDVRVPERPAAGGLEPTDAPVAATDLQPEVQTSQ